MKKPKIGNLTAKMTGITLSPIQEADALIEFNKLIEYVDNVEPNSSPSEAIDTKSGPVRSDLWKSIVDIITDINKIDILSGDALDTPSAATKIEQMVTDNYAIQQIEGFEHAKSGYDIESLVEGMGLTKEEWDRIKNKVNMHVTRFQSIRHYFEKQ